MQAIGQSTFATDRFATINAVSYDLRVVDALFTSIATYNTFMRLGGDEDLAAEEWWCTIYNPAAYAFKRCLLGVNFIGYHGQAQYLPRDIGAGVEQLGALSCLLKVRLYNSSSVKGAIASELTPRYVATGWNFVSARLKTERPRLSRGRP